MKPKRSKEHTTLTETAALVVREIEKIPGVKKIAPGMITTLTRRRSGERFVTVVYTAAGMELSISGQSVQKVAVHTTTDPKEIVAALQRSKRLQGFTWKTRDRFPGI